MHIVPQCNIFNFSLADIDSNHERIVKSQLHLYMEREATNSLFYVSIRELQTFEEAEVSEYLKVRPSQGSGWVVFDVHKEVIALIQSGNFKDILCVFEQAWVKFIVGPLQIVGQHLICGLYYVNFSDHLDFVVMLQC